jgi:hypothetical protein
MRILRCVLRLADGPAILDFPVVKQLVGLTTMQLVVKIYNIYANNKLDDHIVIRL